MAYLTVDIALKLFLVLALCCPAVGLAQTDAEGDDFKLARNLFRDAGDYATASALFAEYIRNYPRSPQLAERPITILPGTGTTVPSVRFNVAMGA